MRMDDRRSGVYGESAKTNKRRNIGETRCIANMQIKRLSAGGLHGSDEAQGAPHPRVLE